MWTLQLVLPNAYFGLGAKGWDAHVSVFSAMSVIGVCRFGLLTLKGWSLVKFDSDSCLFQKVMIED